ncbi:hypothetical protein C7974DRAFT_391916 [Boeremia exigua]|uniref:uncharacterized protein n=1 Tax=Boeremia exigua TaxID=749465 RepID=UPI001E8D6701|nr:uncharacterized protein C7974DRAFT_391916 [Boeremia exigua]KAH6633001.1 hypothetical protein C7974DRAFT_391916 [Boeremia exigua]
MAPQRVHHPDEAPPEYSVRDPQLQATPPCNPRMQTTPPGNPQLPATPPKRKWTDNRVRVWSLVALGVLAIIIFGAAYGVKRSRSDDAENSRDQQLQAWSSSRAIYPTGTPATSSSFPDPTPGPTQPVLQAQGPMPRDISVAVEVPDLLIWDLRARGRIYTRKLDRDFEVDPYRQLLVTPVVVNTGETTRTAVAVNGVSGGILYMHFHDGRWEDWQELEFAAKFLRRPAVISRAQHRVDVVNVDSEGSVWIVSYDGSAWSEWTQLGTNVSADVSATTWGEDRIDVFISNGETFMHKHWTPDSGWPENWEDLGNPFGRSLWTRQAISPGPPSISSPMAVSWRDGDDGVIDIFVTDGSSRHKMFRGGAWSDWLIVSASHEGGEFPDTQSIVKGRGGDGYPFAHVISRGTNNCMHLISHNGTDWDFWTNLWCNTDNVGNERYYPTEILATSMAVYENGSLEVVVKDLLDNVLRLQLEVPVDPNVRFSNGEWDNLGSAG